MIWLKILVQRFKYRNHDRMRMLGADGVYTQFVADVRKLCGMSVMERAAHYADQFHPIDRALLVPFLESYLESYRAMYRRLS